MRNGFSLIEMLVVMTILATLSSILLVYNRRTGEQIAVFRDQELVTGTIIRAKSLAIEKYVDPDNPDSCAFGVYFNIDPTSEFGSEFFLFQDLRDPSAAACRDSEGNPLNSFTYDVGEEINKVSLGTRLRFSLYEDDDFPNPACPCRISSDANILFIPPDPVAAFRSQEDGGVLDFPLTVVVESERDSTERACVEISSAGQVNGMSGSECPE